MAKKTLNPCEMVLKLTVDTEIYFDVYYVKNKGVSFNIIMGARGIGKTENNIGLALTDFKERGKQFIYMRRYKPELSGASDLLNKWLDDYQYMGDKNGGGTYTWGGNKLGWAVPLSTAHNYKSGYDFSNVDTLIYDEAILMPGTSQRYLGNEITAFLEAVSTIFRLRTGYKVYILGNNLSFFNPYTEYFKVKLFKNEYIDRDRDLFIGFFKDSPQLRKMEENTPLYKLTKGTAYHEYHYNNMALAKSIVTYTHKTNNDKIFIRLILNNYTLNIYFKDSIMLCEGVQKIFNDGITIKILSNNEPNWYNLQEFKLKYYKLFMYKYSRDEVRFTSQDSFSLLTTLLDLF